MNKHPLPRLVPTHLLGAVVALGLLVLSAQFVFGQPTSPGSPPSTPAAPSPAPPVPDSALLPPHAPALADKTTAFFNPDPSTPVPELEIKIADSDIKKLRQDARTYVPCTIFENGKQILLDAKPAVKIKGSAGSLRSIDDKPALTLNTDKLRNKSAAHLGGFDPTFHGLEKIHLNNSVQDDGLLNEWICSEVFRSAGYPAARVAHARVNLNGRTLGEYVVIEGFDKHFLQRFFKDATGNMYDGGFLQDVNSDLGKDGGKGADDHSDLKALAAACSGDNPPSHWPELEKLLDIDGFLKFMALERICGHWDGYTQNRNNYRIYFPTGGKAWFLPHGMDQTFTDPNFSVLSDPGGLVAVAVMRNPAWRTAYRKELSKLVENFDAAALTAKIKAVEARLQPAITKISPDAARAQAGRANELIERITERAKSLREQAAQPEPQPLVFNIGQPVLIDAWKEVSETDGAVHDGRKIDGAPWKRISHREGSADACVASYRRVVTLPPGRYSLEADVRTRNVEPIAGEVAPRRGAGLRISGGVRTEERIGTTNGPMHFDFTVDAERDVVLVLELRAIKGSAAFKADSLKLTRLLDKPTK